MMVGEGINGNHSVFIALVDQESALKKKLQKAVDCNDGHKIKKVQYHLNVTRKRIFACSDPAI